MHPSTILASIDPVVTCCDGDGDNALVYVEFLIQETELEKMTLRRPRGKLRFRSPAMLLV